MRLEKAVAPAYWTRWRVYADDGVYLGVVEKRGRFAPWYAFCGKRSVAIRARTRAEAIEAVCRNRYAGCGVFGCNEVATRIVLIGDEKHPSCAAHAREAWEDDPALTSVEDMS